MKPHLKVIAGRPVLVTAPRAGSPAVAKAREAYGKPFAHESGSPFQWTSGPRVLTEWLFNRQKDRT